MSSLARTRRLRWAVPVVVAAVIGLIAVIPTLSAGATPSLAPLTPEQLLVKVQQSHVEALSGGVTLTTNLGIPNLSNLGDVTGQGSGFNPVDLLSGSHQFQVWVDGPDRQRVALPSSLAETDVVHNGSDVWIWQSSGSKVEHIVGSAGHPAGGSTASGTPSTETPAQLADQLLAQVGPSTDVSVASPDYVAGRAAYELQISPRSDASTVDSILIAVDAATGLPLKVSITAKGQIAPALELGFSSITFSRPAASTFEFTPPPGSTLKTTTLGGSGAKGGHQPQGSDATGARVVGQDWTQVVIAPTDGRLFRGAGVVLRAATPVSGTWGSGRLLQTSLVNVLLLDDGRVAAGAVSPGALEAAVASAG
jgi:outer membrane lipoprotein-sorting protein